MSEDLARRLPHYPVPVVVIGRLAVDHRNQGLGIGEFLLLDAIRRVEHASNAIGIYAVVVEARNDQVRNFYQRYGFRPFQFSSNRLFLPLQTFVRLGL